MTSRLRDPATFAALGRIAAITLGLLAAGAAMRAVIWWQMQPGAHRFAAFIRTVPPYDAPDARIAVALGAIAALLALALPHAARRIARFWFGLACVLALLAGINVTAVYWLRGPVTWQWLYYADFLRSFTSRSVVGAVLTWQAFVFAGVAPLVFLAVDALVAAVLRWTGRKGGEGVALAIAAMLLATIALYSATRPAPVIRFRGTFANPLAEFAASGWSSLHSGLPDPRGEDDADYRTGAAQPSPADPRRRPRNVILIVMESVGARFVLGGQATALPNIAALRRMGRTFTAAYAPTASSTRSAFAILAARYPRFSYRPETYTLTDAPLVLLPERMRRASYDTAFFMAGDFAFQGLGRFLAQRGFDRMADLGQIPCARLTRASSTRWAHVDHVSDACATDALLRWIAEPRTHPFFATFWSIDTHFPYSAGADAPADPERRYLAALRNLDGQIGRIVAAVRAAGKLDDTVFVLVGDHGEAFEEHGNFSHGSTIFEEETHVPLIFANPQLFRGEADPRLASLIDIGPTLLAASGLSSEPSWEGRDLLGSPNRRRVYLFAAQRDLIAGYREADAKIVDNLRFGTVDRYDLARDPGEEHPRRLTGSAAATAARHIAGWAEYQEGLYRAH